MDLYELRAEYHKGGLRRSEMAPDPHLQFERWMQEATQAGVVEPNAMVLATVDASNRPAQRTVLLKQFDARGFVFFTNLESAKARQIEANPAVSLLFPWILLERQCTIQGRAERVSTAEALKYFLQRPFGSRLGAWASPQSTVIRSRALLEMKLEEMKRKFASGQVPLPSFWGGFRVRAESFEFWQGRRNRLHDRILYRREGPDGWGIERLAP